MRLLQRCFAALTSSLASESCSLATILCAWSLTAQGAPQFEQLTPYSVSLKLCGVTTKPTRAPDGSLFGTAPSIICGGVVSSNGSIYKRAPDGTVTLLHNFGVDSPAQDGIAPLAEVTLGPDGSLYGTTVDGGVNDLGVVFKYDARGNYTVLHRFEGTDAFANRFDGAEPVGGVTLTPDGTLYGTTSSGGNVLGGTIYTISPAGVYRVVHSFDTFIDGFHPRATLTRGPDGTLYGTAYDGGLASGPGTVFKFHPSNGFEVVYRLRRLEDGFRPEAGVTLGADGSLYGAAFGGGLFDFGTLFKIDSQGVFRVLHHFNPTDPNDGAGGAVSTPVLSPEGRLYGTTVSNFLPGVWGTVYQVDERGQFSHVYRFRNDGDGSGLRGGVILGRDGNLYGTAQVSSFLYRILLDPADTDGDGIANTADNCINVRNPDQRDADGDGYGSLCDADVNNDGIVNNIDLALFRQRFLGADANADINGDGVVNTVDLALLKRLFGARPGPSGLVP